MGGGNRYFTWDGYYRGPGAGLGFLVVVGLVVYGATHPDVAGDVFERIKSWMPDEAPAAPDGTGHAPQPTEIP